MPCEFLHSVDESPRAWDPSPRGPACKLCGSCLLPLSKKDVKRDVSCTESIRAVTGNFCPTEKTRVSTQRHRFGSRGNERKTWPCSEKDVLRPTRVVRCDR